jgi:hypothetical protein
MNQLKQCVLSLQMLLNRLEPSIWLRSGLEPLLSKTMLRTINQNNRFHTLIQLRKITKEEKQELVNAFTGGREMSSAKMTMDEMDALIKHLEGEDQASIKRMRSKIINIAKDIFAVSDLTQKDWDALNTFLVNKFKTPLHMMKNEQLRNAVTAMEKWRGSETKKMVKELLNGF